VTPVAKKVFAIFLTKEVHFNWFSTFTEIIRLNLVALLIHALFSLIGWWLKAGNSVAWIG